MHRSIPLPWILVGCFLAGCGGGEPTAVTPPDPEPASGGGEPQAAEPAEPEAEGDASSESESSSASAEPDEAALPEPEPIEATDAKAVREALITASRGGEAFLRIVDPEKGIGGWDREEGMRAHFCDRKRFGREPTLGYQLLEGDEWSCNDELTRCSSVDPEDRIGTVFHFHDAGGDSRWLASVIRYDRRVPRRDPQNVREWTEGAEGVCEMWRALTGDPEEITTEKVTMFVSRFTDEVEESTTDFHCGEEATKIANEILTPLMEEGPPTLCHRKPLACVWMVESDVRVYAQREAPGTPLAIAKLAADLPEGPAGAQARQIESVVKRALVRRCR